jgi:hypothetical protein
MVLRLARRRREVESRLHRVRDVSMGEDASRARRGAAPQVLAALRSPALAPLRGEGVSDIAAASRERAADARKAVRRIWSPPFG